MRYQVMGVRTQSITVEVEAGSPDEAVEKAQTNMNVYNTLDVWDTDDNFLEAIELY